MTLLFYVPVNLYNTELSMSSLFCFDPLPNFLNAFKHKKIIVVTAFYEWKVTLKK